MAARLRHPNVVGIYDIPVRAGCRRAARRLLPLHEPHGFLGRRAARLAGLPPWRLPGYHLLRLEAVRYPQAEKAADWEFTYDRGGVLVHILNRNILANSHHAYALYWSVPQSDWNADYHYFQAFAATFQPAS